MNTVASKLAVVSITPNGNRLARRLAALTPCDCYTSDKLVQPGFIGFDGGFAQCVARLFAHYQSLVFICATGIVVRTLAPLIHDKLADPAVVVIDEQGKHVISLLSGHVGGANQLTLKLASLLDADPVITTATDVNQVAALDNLAQQINADVVDYRRSVKLINQMLVSGKRVGVYQQDARIDDLRGLIVVDDIERLPELDAMIWISMASELPPLALPIVQMVPRRIVAGIGCRRGTEQALIYQALMGQFSENCLSPLALQAIGSIDIKRDEQGLIQLAERLSVPFRLYSAQRLAPLEQHFPQSSFVKKTVGVGSVSQPVAWLMSEGNLRGKTLKQQGITITLGVATCCMS
jgi:cobalt-precorrin 5A hydrolase